MLMAPAVSFGVHGCPGAGAVPALGHHLCPISDLPEVLVSAPGLIPEIRCLKVTTSGSGRDFLRPASGMLPISPALCRRPLGRFGNSRYFRDLNGGRGWD